MLYSGSPWEPSGPDMLKGSSKRLQGSKHLLQCIWYTPKDWGGQTHERQRSWHRNLQNWSTDHLYFNQQWTHWTRASQQCSEQTHLSALCSFTQNLVGKMQFISYNAAIIPLADQRAAVTSDVSSRPFQQRLSVTAVQVEEVGSRRERLSVFSLIWGWLPLEVETCYFVLKPRLEGYVAAMKSSHRTILNTT